jgi:hypothetical protein
MKTLTKALTATVLAVTFALGAIALTPANAQVTHHPLRKAARLDRRAAKLQGAAAKAYAAHHPRKAAKLAAKAAKLSAHANHLDHHH